MRHSARAVLVLAAWLALGGTGAAQTETVEFYALDAIGSVRIVFDVTGNVLARLDYAPFGQELTAAPNAPDRKFAQLFRDGEAGLDYAVARSYQARTGRFNAPDPLLGSTLESQQLNRYAYAVNNPLVFVDPTGLRASECKTTVSESYDEVYGQMTTVALKCDSGGGGAGLGLADFIRFAFETIGRRQEPVRPIEVDWGRIFRERTAPGIVGTAVANVVRPDSSTGERVEGAGTLAMLIAGPALKGLASGTGGATAPMTVVKYLPTGTAKGMIDEMKELTWTTGNEYAIVRLSTGQRALVSGGPDGIDFIEGQISRVIIHTHPYGRGAIGPSADDFGMLNALGQTFSLLINPGGFIQRFRPR